MIKEGFGQIPKIREFEDSRLFNGRYRERKIL